jgi:hypothetical protein
MYSTKNLHATDKKNWDVITHFVLDEANCIAVVCCAAGGAAKRREVSRFRCRNSFSNACKIATGRPVTFRKMTNPKSKVTSSTVNAARLAKKFECHSRHESRPRMTRLLQIDMRK